MISCVCRARTSSPRMPKESVRTCPALVEGELVVGFGVEADGGVEIRAGVVIVGLTPETHVKFPCEHSLLEGA